MHLTVAPHEADILRQTGLIYAVLLGGTLVLGGILFGARQFSLWRSGRNAQETRSRDVELKTIKSNDKSANNSNFATEYRNDQVIEHDLCHKRKREKAHGPREPQPVRIDVIRLLDSGSTGQKSPIRLLPISNHLQSDHGPVPLLHEDVPWLPDPQQNASLQELYDVQLKIATESLALKEDLHAVKRIRLSQCVNPSVVIPPIRFSSVWRANQAVDETRAVLVDANIDTCTKSIWLVRVAAIAAAHAYSLAVNPFRLYSFQELIEQLVDTGLVFQIITQLLQPKYSMLLVVDTVCSYSWHTWMETSSELTGNIGDHVGHEYRTTLKHRRSNRSRWFGRQNFDRSGEMDYSTADFGDSYDSVPWRQSNGGVSLSGPRDCLNQFNGPGPNAMNGAVARTRVMVIRLFCNLLLGLDGETAPQFVHMKLSVLLERMMLGTRCHEYLVVVPMVAQAIALAMGGRIKTVFYDALYVVVVKHHECCVDQEYLDSSLVLREVISDGIASHSAKERQKAMRLREEIERPLLRERHRPGYTERERFARDEGEKKRINVHEELQAKQQQREPYASRPHPGYPLENSSPSTREGSESSECRSVFAAAR